MEDQLLASRRAWLASIERFSKIIEGDLEQARARSPNGAEVRELEQLQLKILRMWGRRVRSAPKQGSKAETKTRWVRREPSETPRESSVD